MVQLFYGAGVYLEYLDLVYQEVGALHVTVQLLCLCCMHHLYCQKKPDRCE